MSMNVLHLASFSGNIGDNANHLGFRPWFESTAQCDVRWTELEIREYYWNERKFDESFVSLVSGFDLLVIGGGNYFELWVEDSATGTSIDIPLEIFAKIKTPIFFNALGCDEGQGVTDLSRARFTRFLELLVSRKQYLITVRNDGSMKALRKHIPSNLVDKIFIVPDGGFFLDLEAEAAPYFAASSLRIGINLASDMSELRFRNFGNPGGYEAFCDEFAKLIEALSEDDSIGQYLFFPHIFSDLTIIADVISRLSDRLRRTRVSAAPYLTGPSGAKHIFGMYRSCNLLLGMRFHANVCAIGMGVPVIGLCNYPQIELLYEELNYPSGCISLRKPGFALLLRSKILTVLSNDTLHSENDGIIKDVTKSRDIFTPILSDWLKRNVLLSHQ
jgi:polysaccharide pyruvyl transferase WcaK-like protein